MDEVETTQVKISPTLSEKFGRVIVTTMATFAATVLAEKVYDKILINRRTKSPEN